ncbi:hypothetical protein BDZ89DRAFT_1066803 [Hymenopellis radicata]|nr:hypothetical protein BDZ89DRAFT_1066803 [Hymenopellis radicata]
MIDRESAYKELTKPDPDNPRAIYHDPNQSGGQRFWSRMKREPLIPAGALLTAFVFCGIVYHSNKRNTRQVQLWMRYRVAAQGLTVCAVVLGMYRLQQDTLEYNKKVENIRGQLEDADKVAKERAEFEERMREAEEAHEAEQGLRNRWRKGKDKQGEKSTFASEEAASSKRWYHYLYWSPTNSKPKDEA